ncbi:hypothetical protein [Sphingomonas sp. SORGH_AS_0879]
MRCHSPCDPAQRSATVWPQGSP